MPEPLFVLLQLASALAGLLDATVGGGGFILIPFMVFTGSAIQLAIGTSRLIFLMDSFSAVVGHARRGNIDYRLALAYSITSVAFVPVGAYVTAEAAPETVSTVFGLFMLAMLALVVWKPKFGLVDRRPTGVLPSLAAGSLIGFMIGLLGGGVGVLIIFALVLVSGTTILLASGTSQVIVWLSNVVALAAYYGRGLVDLRLGLILGLAALVGAQAGVVLAHRAGNRLLRILLIALTLASAVKLLLA